MRCGSYAQSASGRKFRSLEAVLSYFGEQMNPRGLFGFGLQTEPLGGVRVRDTSPTLTQRSDEGIHHPHRPIETVVLEVLGDQLGEAIVLRIRPQMGVEP